VGSFVSNVQPIEISPRRRAHGRGRSPRKHRAFHLALLAPAALTWDIRILMMSWRASERYVRIGFGLLDPDPSEHDRRRDAHQLLVDQFRQRDPQVAARALDQHLAHNEELAHAALSGSVAGKENPRSVQ
jgi:DNA-binding GntR family transcriptional regulator